MKCPYCGAELEYMGIEDGAGDYADSLAEMWHCVDCNEDIVGFEMQIDDEESEE